MRQELWGDLTGSKVRSRSAARGRSKVQCFEFGVGIRCGFSPKVAFLVQVRFGGSGAWASFRPLSCLQGSKGVSDIAQGFRRLPCTL